MFARVSAVFVLLAIGASVDANLLDDVTGVTKDVGNFFSNQFKNAKDLFSNDQGELEKNVEKVKELLVGLKEKAKYLETVANDEQKETLKKVDSFLEQVTGFQNEVKEEGAAKFEENKGKWEKMVTDIFDKGDLSSVTKLLGIQNSSPVSQMFAALLAPVFYLVFAH